MKSNYYFETSLPAYHDNQAEKVNQAQRILNYLHALGGQGCIRQLAKMVGLPDSTVAGRINDLKKEGKVDSVDTIEFEGRKRKRFFIVKKAA